MLYQHTSLATNSSLQIHSAFLSKTIRSTSLVTPPQLSAHARCYGVPPPFRNHTTCMHCACARRALRQYLSRDTWERCVSFLDDLALLNFVRDHNPVPFFPTFIGSSTKFWAFKLLRISIRYWLVKILCNSLSSNSTHIPWHLHSLAWCTIPFWSVHVIIVSELPHIYIEGMT